MKTNIQTFSVCGKFERELVRGLIRGYKVSNWDVGKHAQYG